MSRHTADEIVIVMVDFPDFFVILFLLSLSFFFHSDRVYFDWYTLYLFLFVCFYLVCLLFWDVDNKMSFRQILKCLESIVCVRHA